MNSSLVDSAARAGIAALIVGNLALGISLVSGPVDLSWNDAALLLVAGLLCWIPALANLVVVIYPQQGQGTTRHAMRAVGLLLMSLFVVAAIGDVPSVTVIVVCAIAMCAGYTLTLMSVLAD